MEPYADSCCIDHEITSSMINNLALEVNSSNEKDVFDKQLIIIVHKPNQDPPKACKSPSHLHPETPIDRRVVSCHDLFPLSMILPSMTETETEILT